MATVAAAAASARPPTLASELRASKLKDLRGVFALGRERNMVNPFDLTTWLKGISTKFENYQFVAVPKGGK